MPAVFKFANDNNYHVVTITAPDGKTWSKKIEVRAYKETVLRVTYKKAAKKPSKDGKKVRSFIGKIRNTCKARYYLRYDFLLDGESKGTRKLDPKQSKDLTLPKGTYDVRVFKATRKKPNWEFHMTIKAEVKADGWKFEPNC